MVFNSNHLVCYRDIKLLCVYRPTRGERTRGNWVKCYEFMEICLDACCILSTNGRESEINKKTMRGVEEEEEEEEDGRM